MEAYNKSEEGNGEGSAISQGASSKMNWLALKQLISYCQLLKL